MRLVLLHPAVAARDCSDCRRWLYTDRPGSFAEKPLERAGKRVPRPPGVPTPCGFCEKQPADVPDRDRSPATALELDHRGWQVYQHYTECKAVGDFPPDPIVRANAAVIKSAEDLADRVYAARLGVPRHPGA